VVGIYFIDLDGITNDWSVRWNPQLWAAQGYVVYFPDENHWILKPNSSLLWHKEVFAWLDLYIGRGPTR